MPEQNEPPRPHGDPLEDVVESSEPSVAEGGGDTRERVERNPEENRAQADSDAPSDASADARGDRLNNSDRADGQGSDANGIPAFDEADGDLRKKLYREGAVLVSRID